MSEKAGGRAEQSDYQSYLLRLWRENDGEGDWRASLESPQTGERSGFASLGALFDHVLSLTRSGSSAQSCKKVTERATGR